MEGRLTPSSPQIALLRFPIDTRNGTVPEWFHGVITRKAAEALLLSKPPGCFLVRVSESRIGFSLSYRTEERCRHFMIDTLVDGSYVIVGETRHHGSLQDLVDFHRRTPITHFHELLTAPCGQVNTGNPIPMPRKKHAANNTRINDKPPPENIPNVTVNYKVSTSHASLYQNTPIFGTVFTRRSLNNKFQSGGSAPQEHTYTETREVFERRGVDSVPEHREDLSGAEGWLHRPPPFSPDF